MQGQNIHNAQWKWETDQRYFILYNLVFVSVVSTGRQGLHSVQIALLMSFSELLSTNNNLCDTEMRNTRPCLTAALVIWSTVISDVNRARKNVNAVLISCLERSRMSVSWFCFSPLLLRVNYRTVPFMAVREVPVGCLLKPRFLFTVFVWAAVAAVLQRRPEVYSLYLSTKHLNWKYI